MQNQNLLTIIMRKAVQMWKKNVQRFKNLHEKWLQPIWPVPAQMKTPAYNRYRIRYRVPAKFLSIIYFSQSVMSIYRFSMEQVTESIRVLYDFHQTWKYLCANDRAKLLIRRGIIKCIKTCLTLTSKYSIVLNNAAVYRTAGTDCFLFVDVNYSAICHVL